MITKSLYSPHSSCVLLIVGQLRRTQVDKQTGNFLKVIYLMNIKDWIETAHMNQSTLINQVWLTQQVNTYPRYEHNGKIAPNEKDR